MTEEVKFPKTVTLGRLDTLIENQEAYFGAVSSLDVVGEYTIGKFDRPRPPVNSLMLALTIGEEAPPIIADQGELLFKGQAYILGQKMGVAAYRVNTSD